MTLLPSNMTQENEESCDRDKKAFHFSVLRFPGGALEFNFFKNSGSKDFLEMNMKKKT